MRTLVNAVFLSAVIFLSGFYSTAFAHEDLNEVRLGIISGQVMIKGGGPMSGGMVYFFEEKAGPPPSSTHYWRVPAGAFDTNSNGRFTAQIPEGKYYTGALKKISGDLVGPPQDGDLFAISQDENGNPKLHEVKKGEAFDIGVLEATLFDRAILAKDGVTAIEGLVLDVDGKPAEGLLVFAFSTQTIVGRPLFVSDRTDKDGKYILRVAGEGTYYLRIRGSYGGGPLKDNELKGVYGDKEPPTAIIIKSGETLTGFDIKAFKFEGRGPKASVPGPGK